MMGFTRRWPGARMQRWSAFDADKRFGIDSAEKRKKTARTSRFGD
jgi:hypothetical protein